MALQLITHSSDGTTQKMPIGSAGHSLKAGSNTMYELRDTNTKKAPQKALAKKVGKNLELDVTVDGQNSHIVIEDYYTASNAQLIGDLGNGEFYPLLADNSSAIPTAELPHTASASSGAYGAGYGSDFVNAGAVASSGVPLASYVVGGLAVVGGGVAAAGAGGSSKSSAPTTPTTPTTPTNAPTATITLSDVQLNTGESATVTVVFSEAVSGFTNSDLVVPNGTLGTLASADGGKTWTGVYTPTANINNATNAITLAAGSYTSTATGLAGSAATSANYTINTTVAPPPAVTATITDDENATANISGGSILYTITFSEGVIGFDASDVTVANGTKGIFTQISPAVYTIEVTPTTNFIGNMTVGVPAGVATSTATNTPNNAAPTSNQTVDTLAPTVVSASLADSALTLGETTEFTVVFSEAVTNFSSANLDMSAANGTLSTLSSNDGGKTWKALFTPTANINDTTNVIQVLNTYIDSASNSGSLAASTNYTINTTTATGTTPSGVTATITDDENATANISGGSILYTITFSEGVIGFDASDVTVANGTKGIFTQISPAVYTIEVTPTTNFIGNMTVGVPAGVATSTATNTPNNAAPTSNQTVDTLAPTVVSASLADSALTLGETTEFTVVFSEAVTNFSSANLDMSAANGTLSTLSSNDGGKTWKALFTPATNINDTTNVIQVLNTYIDSASNSGSLAASTNYTINTTTATSDTIAPTAKITIDKQQLKAGDTAQVIISFDEKVANFDTTDLVVSNGTISNLTSTDNITWSATFVPAKNIEDTTNVISIANTYTDIYGNVGTGASSSDYSIDTKIPTPSISLDTDSGASNNDRITNSSNYTVAQSEAGSTIEYSTNGGATWVTSKPTASEGVNSISVRETDLAGNVSDISTLNFTLDSIKPDALTITLNNDTGVSTTDKTTSDGAYTISTPESGTKVEYSTNGGTTWVTSKPTAIEGANNISVRQTDVAGNVSDISTLNFTFDSIKPTLKITDDETAEVANMDGTNSDGTIDANGGDILYTFTFSEAAVGFTASNVVVTGGTQGTFTKVSDLVYTMMIKPTPGFEGVMSVSVDKASYSDVAGNTGNDLSDTVSKQTVDMRAPFPIGTNDPAITAITADPANSRIVLTFDENLEQVNQTSPTSFGVIINGVVQTVTAVGVSDNVAGMADNQVFLYLATVTNARGELFDWSTAGISVLFVDDTKDLTSIIQDLAGNDATSFYDTTLDMLAPNVKITMSDTNIGAGDVSVITFKFSEAVNLKASDIDLSGANGKLDTLTSTDGGKTWTANFVPTVGISDATNTIVLNGTYTDMHGNLGTGASSVNYNVDTLSPKLVGYTGDGTTDTITLTFDEVLDAVNFSPESMFSVTDGTLTPAPDDGAALQQYKITSVAIDGNKAILSIDPAVLSTAGTEWKLTYNDPTGNTATALQDLYGSDVSSFVVNVVI